MIIFREYTFFKSIKSYRILNIIGTRFSKILICFCINKCLGFSGSLNCMRSTDLDSSFPFVVEKVVYNTELWKNKKRKTTQKVSDLDTKKFAIYTVVFFLIGLFLSFLWHTLYFTADRKKRSNSKRYERFVHAKEGENVWLKSHFGLSLR